MFLSQSAKEIRAISHVEERAGPAAAGIAHPAVLQIPYGNAFFR